jgi:hypothetical protein
MFAPHSMSNKTSIRLTASTAIGEITVAFLPRRALAAISASSKNCLRAFANTVLVRSVQARA